MEPNERFWSQVEIGEVDACWIWKGKRVDGYGRVYWKGKRAYAHRIAWELANKMAIPDGLNVLHSCDEPACVNPAHLHLGTQGQNMREMKEKGRSTYGEKNAQAKITDEQVLEIRRLHSEGKLSMKEISRLVGLSYSNVRKIVKGERWQHVPD